MTKRKTSAPMKTEQVIFFCLLSALLILCLAWLLLNHYRGEFYDTSMIGGPSPYLAIVQLQRAVRWPIYVLAVATLVSGVLLLSRRNR